VLPLGSSDRRLTLADSPTGRESGAPGHQRPARAMQLWAAPPKGVPRPFLDSARWQHETGPWGTQPPHHQTGNADTEPGAPLSRPPQHARPADAINHAHLTNDTTYQLQDVYVDVETDEPHRSFLSCAFSPSQSTPAKTYDALVNQPLPRLPRVSRATSSVAATDDRAAIRA